MTLISWNDLLHLAKDEARASYKELSSFAECKRDEQYLASVEEQLHIRLPESFKQIVNSYCFDEVEICDIWFSYMRQPYNQSLVSMNQDGYKWWPGESRPDDLVLVARCDPYCFILNIVSNQISLHDAMYFRDPRAFVVASNFECFVLGIGTVEYHMGSSVDWQQLANTLQRECGASSNNTYWRELAERWLAE